MKLWAKNCLNIPQNWMVVYHVHTHLPISLVLKLSSLILKTPKMHYVEDYHISILIKIQPDATVCRYLFTVKSLYMFRVSQHPSSGVLKTVTPTYATGHNTGTTISLQRGHWPRWREVAVPIFWPVPEVAVTVFSTPDDGCCDTRNM